jgi:hypothetical protein
MSGIFFTAPLVKSSSQGSAWAQVDAYFPELQVFANCLLSAYRTQNGERFAPFEPRWTEAYIVTPQTPTTSIVGVSIPTRRDNTIFELTSRLTFWLQVNNASASAVGIIYDFGTTADFSLGAAVGRLDLAVHSAEDGTVVATHRAVRFDGGPDIDEDEVRERVLAEAYVLADRQQGSLQITAFDGGAIPSGTDIRIYPSTGVVEPLRAEDTNY